VERIESLTPEEVGELNVVVDADKLGPEVPRGIF
jgi:hypothetical protein